MKTHVALPNEIFNKVMNVLVQLPYNQVGAIVDEVKQTGVEVNVGGDIDKYLAPETDKEE